jgi:hypothetical protein
VTILAVRAGGKVAPGFRRDDGKGLVLKNFAPNDRQAVRRSRWRRIGLRLDQLIAAECAHCIRHAGYWLILKMMRL